MDDDRTTDAYDATQDARSDERYEDDPSAEPGLEETKQHVYFPCVIDESAVLAERHDV